MLFVTVMALFAGRSQLRKRIGLWHVSSVVAALLLVVVRNESTARAGPWPWVLILSVPAMTIVLPVVWLARVVQRLRKGTPNV